MNLQKKLALWQQENLITQAQGEAIAAFENHGRKPVLTWALLALSCFCIFLGIISVISANWQEISPNWKLFLDFTILIITAGAIVNAYRKGQEILFEWLLIFFAGLILASIGLIAQIYQIQQQGLMGFLLWCVLTFPVMLFCRKIILPLFWLPVFIPSLMDRLMEIDFMERIAEIVEKAFPFAIPVAGILLFAFIYRLLSVHFRTRLAAQIRAIKFWLVFDISILVLVMDFCADSVSSSTLIGQLFDNYNWVSVIIISCLIVGTVGFGYFSYRYNYSRLLTCILAILLGFSLIYTTLPDNKNVLNLWGFLLSMSVLSCLVAYALIKSRVKLLNLSTALMALRFFIVFLQIFGSLLMTGVGLIICGFVFLGTIYAWRKLHLDSLISVKESK